MRVIGRTPLLGAVGVGILSLAVTACGPSADAPLLSISPQEAGTEDTLRLLVAEREGFTYEIAWTVDGEPVADVTHTVDADLTSRGQTWEVTVTPVDSESGKEFEPSVTSVTIGNSAPFGIVTLTPGAPGTGTDLVAQPGFTDPDGDEVTATYSWTVNGADAGISSNTVTGDKLVKGDVWEVTVVASDGTAENEPVTASTTVANSPPRVEGAAIRPEVVYDDTEVTCVGRGFSDPDGDAEGYKVIWKVDGLVVSSEATLTGEFFDRGQVLSCELVPTDGEDDGIRVFSSEVLVRNGVPTLDAIEIDDPSPTRNAAITFTATGVSDADGDDVALNVWWLVNGRGVSTDMALDPVHFQRGDTIGLQVYATDGVSQSATLTADTVVVGNAPPVILSSAFNVDPMYTDALLMPDNDIVDRDGDPITLTYVWEVNGSVVGDETGTLDGNDIEGNGFDKGDTVSYTLTVNDGIEDGDVYESPVVTVANKPPEYPDVSIVPGLSLDDEDLHCAFGSEPVDADGDTLTPTFTWTLDGSAYAGLTSTTDYTGDTIPAAATELEDAWACTVSLSDGTDTTVTDPIETIVRPEYIYYTAESKSDLGNAGSSCSSDGKTGYYTYMYYSAGTQWISEDVYKTSPDTLTFKWRQGYRENSTSYDYVRLNGTQLYYGTGLPIARSSTCDSGRVYEFTISGSAITGIWNSGGTNRFEIAHGCCSYYNNGVFYDDEVQYGRLRVHTDVDPE